MGKILVIAEKPSVARDYARVLHCTAKKEGYIEGDQYIVAWAIGHLIELCEPEKYDPRFKRWNFQDLPIIPTEIKLQVIRGNGKQFSVLKKLMNSKEVDSLICGTDSGREGELIFRYIYEMAGCKKPFQRLWVSSMTDEAITRGFADLKDGHEYDTLYASAKCRSEADWLVGINGSRAYTIQYDALLSIGRVQTPTLSMIVKRQAQIDAFVPDDYFEVKLTHPIEQTEEEKEEGEFVSTYFTMEASSKEASERVKTTRILKKEEAEQIAERAKTAGKAVVEHVTSTPGKQLPPLLYDLTELQRDANRKFGYSANKTLQIAQSLYEKHKLLTYPRTDARYISDDMKAVVKQTLYKLNIPEFHEYLMGLTEGLHFTKRIVDNTKITDHHAIIPTNKTPELSKLSKEEASVYKMVVMRLIEVFYPAYEYETVEVVLKVGEDSFAAKGRTVIRLGFMKLRKSDDPEKTLSSKKKKTKVSEDDTKKLPSLVVGQVVNINKAEAIAKKTQPPKPFTEATLLTAMEYAGKYIEDEELKEEMNKLSLGTPATRAAIIERLIKVKYIYRQKKALIPTEKGKKLIGILPMELKSPEMTGKWERSLDLIYADKMQSGRFMESIRRYVVYIVQSAKTKQDVEFEKDTYKSKKTGVYAPRESLGKCPLCGGDVLKNRKAYYCSNWRKGCKLTIWQDALDKEGAHLTDEAMKQLLTRQAAMLDNGHSYQMSGEGKIVPASTSLN